MPPYGSRRRRACRNSAGRGSGKWEVGVQLPGQAEQLPDVAFAVANMNAARGIAQQAGGSAQIVQPAHAFLALDRHARWIDPLREGVRSLELLPGPELDRGHSQRQPVRRHRQARMHQQSADRVHAVATEFVLAAAHLCREAHRLRPPAPPGKLRRVMKNEDRAIAGGEPAPSRVEMAPKKTLFALPGRWRGSGRLPLCWPSLGKPAGCSLRTRLPFAPPVGEGGCPADRRQAGSRKVPRQTTDPP